MGGRARLSHCLLKTMGLVALLTLSSLPDASSAQAQGTGFNPDSLSFFEQPLAFRLLGFTFNYNQLVDVPVIFDFEDDDKGVHPRTNFQLTAERQLPNALTIGAVYFGSYDGRDDDEYEDRWALFVRGVWGRLAGGEVNETVREATRRWRGTGNADLEFDDVLGTLDADDLGIAYNLRLSAYTLSVAVDEDGNADIGMTYERPNKFVDLRFSARLTASEVRSLDGATRFDTFAGGLVGQIEYGSLAADVGLGWEDFDGPAAHGSRLYVSAGLHYKVRRLTLSAEGHVGTLDGDSEKSAALGLRYDIARGLSANLGYNYATSDADIDGIAIQRIDRSEAIGSLRYEF